ncbi:MAG: carbohydrate binding domain-containing protein, partial [Melioribacteraceae bacterium]|nr:carbohydrate binding domain-containing protein [Melioribacteraceae bacterium]
NGNFLISNVPKATYDLKIQKTFIDGSYLSTTSSLDVNNDIYLSSLQLPNGVILYKAKNVSASQAIISWSPTNANDFREYKLFRHISSGIDENTGTLVHVSTAIADTTFTDTNLEPLKNYYYRIYLMNEYGKLGGSNIIGITTENKNLISNGDFENIGTDGLPTEWIFRDNKDIFSTLVSSDSYSGNNYLLINPTKYVYDLSWGSMRYRIPYTSLVPGEQYTISFWYYIEALEGNSTLMIELKPEQSTFIFDSVTGQESGVWKKYERTFTAPSDNSKDYYLELETQVHIPYNQELWKVRIDDVKLLKSE